jgi:hypothetical protein
MGWRVRYEADHVGIAVSGGDGGRAGKGSGLPGLKPMWDVISARTRHWCGCKGSNQPPEKRGGQARRRSSA